MNTQSLIAWRESSITVTNDLRSAPITLHDLYQPQTISTLAHMLVTNSQLPLRTAHMMVMHYAIDAIVIAWFAPLIRDNVQFDVNAQDIGVVIDDRGRLGAIWIHTSMLQHVTPIAIDHFGASLAPIFDELVERIHDAGLIGRRGIMIACIETLVRRTTSLERRFGSKLPADWQQQLLWGLGYTEPSISQSFIIHPDAGPDIEMPIPTVCCVLSKHADNDACPTCPKHPSHDIRRILTEQWVSTLSDDEFLGVTGRRRIERMA